MAIQEMHQLCSATAASGAARYSWSPGRERRPSPAPCRMTAALSLATRAARGPSGSPRRRRSPAAQPAASAACAWGSLGRATRTRARTVRRPSTPGGPQSTAPAPATRCPLTILAPPSEVTSYGGQVAGGAQEGAARADHDLGEGGGGRRAVRTVVQSPRPAQRWVCQVQLTCVRASRGWGNQPLCAVSHIPVGWAATKAARGRPVRGSGWPLGAKH